MSSKKDDIKFCLDMSRYTISSLQDIKSFLIKARIDAKRSAKKKWTKEIEKVTKALATAKATRALVMTFKKRV